MHPYERRRQTALRADQQLITRAAAWLRHDAVQAHYAGALPNPEYAFGLASILDLLARRAEEDDALRDHAVRVCRTMLGDRMDMPATRRTRRR
ncbi:hypothetical protein [Pseudonocardia oroxyli]|uniref:Uncharacterized protein n=1 Tax=Pseudonocardia oroxyli TaxID=366584 RepID=A0A1G7PNQ9_PSEOR|nr:hypothetical protein [Pseudonocardia oroxyli]SDF87836.1 hypothetical protein SAMN05216377_107184 [Pseudonocardia oroxyli]